MRTAALRCTAYCRRALEYGRLDQQFRHRSRFLAAASMVSHVLSMVERYGFFVVGRSGVRLLSNISASLNRLNLQIVDRLGITDASPDDASPDLDECWVRLEQSAVQEILRARRNAQPNRFEASMRGIDRLLSLAAVRVPIGSSHALFLGDVIRTVARTSRQPLRFANQGDRERIGLGLIQKIRAQEHDVTQ